VVPDRQSEPEDGGATGEVGREKKEVTTWYPAYALPENRCLPVYLPERSFVPSPQHAPIPRGPPVGFAIQLRHGATMVSGRPVRGEKQFPTRTRVPEISWIMSVGRRQRSQFLKKEAETPLAHKHFFSPAYCEC